MNRRVCYSQTGCRFRVTGVVPSTLPWRLLVWASSSLERVLRFIQARIESKPLKDWWVVWWHFWEQVWRFVFFGEDDSWKYDICIYIYTYIYIYNIYIHIYTTFCITFVLGICLCRHDLWREQWPDRHWHKHLEDLHATYINMYIPHHIYGFSIIWNRNNLKPPQLPFGRKHDGYQTAASFSCAEKRLEEAGIQDDWRLLILTALGII